ncbi:MAG TPA: prefoldin subunit alpha [Candidatus Norongarragalinales archaeon]|nr:prefoldin subunit alpha [Candidatus Norongarragalinales archaeon]
MTSENEREMQKLAMEMNYYRAQAEQIQQQASALRGLVQENRSSKESLEKMSESETMFPTGSGVFVKAKPSSKKVLVEIGAGVIVEKTADEAVKTLDERHEQLLKALDTIQDSLTQLNTRMNALGEQAERMEERR